MELQTLIPEFRPVLEQVASNQAEFQRLFGSSCLVLPVRFHLSLQAETPSHVTHDVMSRAALLLDKTHLNTFSEDSNHISTDAYNLLDAYVYFL